MQTLYHVTGAISFVDEIPLVIEPVYLAQARSWQHCTTVGWRSRWLLPTSAAGSGVGSIHSCLLLLTACCLAPTCLVCSGAACGS